MTERRSHFTARCCDYPGFDRAGTLTSMSKRIHMLKNRKFVAQRPCRSRLPWCSRSACAPERPGPDHHRLPPTIRRPPEPEAGRSISPPASRGLSMKPRLRRHSSISTTGPTTPLPGCTKVATMLGFRETVKCTKTRLAREKTRGVLWRIFERRSLLPQHN
jgi:hypothetical protein